MASFVAILREVGEVVAGITTVIPADTCDAKDDYLLAYAIVGAADYLVTGDMDLLVLESIGSLAIVSPADIVTLPG